MSEDKESGQGDGGVFSLSDIRRGEGPADWFTSVDFGPAYPTDCPVLIVGPDDPIEWNGKIRGPWLRARRTIVINKHTHRVSFENETEDSVEIVIEPKDVSS